MNISDNHAHTVLDSKEGLEFILSNSGRDYLISNKGASLFDYDILDRLMKGVAIDT